MSGKFKKKGLVGLVRAMMERRERKKIGKK
jgi:hypothetical protein